MRTANKSIIAALFFLALFVCLSAGCERQHSHNVTTAWAHAGQASERAVLQRQIAQFNRQHYKHPIALTFIPERQYNAQVQAAALAGDLPDVLEFDGPYLYNYIWQQQLRPLDKLLPRKLIDDLLPSIIKQGTYGHHLYSIGVYDSGLGLYARKSALQKIHARIPRSAADAWSVAEFDQILAELAKRDPDRAVLDLKLNYTGEWYTYAFSPVIESAGGDLIDRRTYQTSNGFINSPAAVAALQQVQHWIQRGWVDPNLDDAAFVSGRVALSWSGHWEYARYKRAWGNDLLVLPLPKQNRTGLMELGDHGWRETPPCRCRLPAFPVATGAGAGHV
ncbi:MAG: extracellular solute-binding protein [Gammaproteobacteria bacterium]